MPSSPSVKVLSKIICQPLLFMSIAVSDHIGFNKNLSQGVSLLDSVSSSIGPLQANLVLIAYESSEGSGEPAHPRSLARTFAARSYKQ